MVARLEALFLDDSIFSAMPTNVDLGIY